MTFLDFGDLLIDHQSFFPTRWANLFMLALVANKARQRTTRELDKTVFQALGIKVPEVESFYITTVGDPMHGLSIPERLERTSSWHECCVIGEGHQANFMHSLVNTTFASQHLNTVLAP